MNKSGFNFKRLITGSLIILHVLFVFPAGLFAQRDFRSGYIIRTNGDTVRGFIQYKAVNPAGICVFKIHEQDKPEELTTKDLNAYRFDEGKYYIRRQIFKDSVAQEVFLEFLIKGKANFFYRRDEGDHYYVEKEDGRLIELTEPEKVLTDARGNEFVKPSLYEGKLRWLFSDCPEIYPDIHNTNLDHSSLISLGKKYHQKTCFNEDCIIFERQRKPVKFRQGVYGGVTVNRLKFGCQPIVEENGVKMADYGDQLLSEYSTGAELGIRFEFENVMTTFEHVSLIADIAVQYFNHYRLTETGTYDMIRYEGTEYLLTRLPYAFYVQYLDVNMKTVAVKIPLMVNYTFFKSKFRPYITGGMMNMIVISQNNQFYLERFGLEYGKTIPVYHYGFTVASGIRLYIPGNHYLFLEGNYEYTQNLSIGPMYRLGNNLFGIKVGVGM